VLLFVVAGIQDLWLTKLEKDVLFCLKSRHERNREMDFTNSKGAYELSEAQITLLQIDVPIIDIVGSVEPPMYDYVRTAIMYLHTKGDPDIEVRITSPGGRVDVGLDVYDLLRLYPGKKTAIVSSQAASMGAVILQACDVRRCMKHSSVLIHHISTSDITLDLLRSRVKMARFRKDMETDQDRLYDILAVKTGKSISEISKACAKDEPMTAEEAKAFGLIDDII
jgi:ATP-dependent Clp protease, protease subunit